MDELQYFISPKMIYNEMSKTVIGQHEAKKAIANALYLHWVTLCYNENHPTTKIKKSNILLAGPSGNGKTFMIQEGVKAIRTLTALSDLMPMVNIDCSNLSYGMWSGTTIENYLELHCDTYKANSLPFISTIVYFDEFDKICGSAISSGGHDLSKGTQYSLLKLIEGHEITIDTHRRATLKIDPSSFLHIFSGNFAEIREARDKKSKKMGFVHLENETESLPLTKQLTNIGLTTQLAGRISQKIEINPLTREQLRTIVVHNLIPPLVKLFDSMNHSLYIPQDIIDDVVNHAIKVKTGARGLQSALDSYIQDKLFETRFPVWVEESKLEEIPLLDVEIKDNEQ